MPRTAPDAPFIISSTLTFQNAMGSLLDYVFGGVFDRYPEPEGGLLRRPGRLDALRPRALRQAVGRAPARRHGFGSKLPSRRRPTWATSGTASSTTRRPRERDVIGIDRITFEIDYPHADSTFPHTEKVAERMAAKAGLNDHEFYALLRRSAIGP